ncbi:MAG: hypothetical protein CSA20_05780 [Deltaproteobacteria bacterium]|nr:MAG: hypothetical protein CSB23_03680 [Deltaproteobacteria bacterium]PIE72971.1 MAG: hypothetical protein CSA20_05780 [Deltaproteobacteria bacterium]
MAGIEDRFRGRYEYVIDDKGRVQFPAAFRNVMELLGSSVLMVIPWKDRLRAYPIEKWAEIETKILQSGLALRRFLDYASGGIVRCTFDNQGRIRITRDTLKKAGIEKEVVFLGGIEYVNILDKKVWQKEHAANHEDFESFNADLSSLGIN